MRITAAELRRFGIVDEVIPEHVPAHERPREVIAPFRVTIPIRWCEFVCLAHRATSTRSPPHKDHRGTQNARIRWLAVQRFEQHTRRLGAERVEALRVADIFRTKVIDTTSESFVFEVTGGPEKIDAFIELMRPIGLAEISRTGVVAIARGPGGLQA
jgi:hypothetical protein